MQYTWLLFKVKELAFTVRISHLHACLHACMYVFYMLLNYFILYISRWSNNNNSKLVSSDTNAHYQLLLQINSNGIISFDEAVISFEAEPFPLPDLKVIAPFWADVDTTGIGTVWYRDTSDTKLLDRARSDILRNPVLFPDIDLQNFFPTSLLIATWDHVGYYDQHTDKVC